MTLRWRVKRERAFVQRRRFLVLIFFMAEMALRFEPRYLEQ